jgi:2-polyprenyl-3-methyl-5-hydroxy-6-metoxy-1,4-benzoquinol methylase
MMSISYYDANAEAYFSDTVGADVSALRERFLAHVPPGGHILDAGCGSGRDARAFAEAGYQVTAFDASAEMVNRAAAYTGLDVSQMSFDDMAWVEEFDGIWACATLLHVPRDKLGSTFARFARALRRGGAWYLSVKHGTGDRVIGGRTFTDMTEQEMRNHLDGMGLSVADLWVTDDVRPGRADRWVNTVAVRNG